MYMLRVDRAVIMQRNITPPRRQKEWYIMGKTNNNTAVTVEVTVDEFTNFVESCETFSRVNLSTAEFIRSLFKAHKTWAGVLNYLKDNGMLEGEFLSYDKDEKGNQIKTTYPLNTKNGELLSLTSKNSKRLVWVNRLNSVRNDDIARRKQLAKEAADKIAADKKAEAQETAKAESKRLKEINDTFLLTLDDKGKGFIDKLDKDNKNLILEAETAPDKLAVIAGIKKSIDDSTTELESLKLENARLQESSNVDLQVFNADICMQQVQQLLEHVDKNAKTTKLIKAVMELIKTAK